MPTTQIFGVILNGGGSRRFGAPKSEALLNGTPLIAHVAQRLAPQVSALAIAGPSLELGFPVLGDGSHAGKGPLAGLLAGLHWAGENGADWLISAPCDVPLFPRNLVALLLEANGETQEARRPIVPCHRDRAEFACSLWPVSLMQRVEEQLTRDRDLSLRSVLEDADYLHLEEGGIDGRFDNVNTRDDLARLSRLEGSC